MTMELYCFGESGNAYKAALTLELSGADWRPRYVDFFNGETRAQDYRDTVNAMGEVPVLVDGDLTLSQSAAIQQYVVDKTGSPLGGAPEDKYEVLRWVIWDNHKMSSQAGTLRFLMNFLPEEKRPQDVISWLSGRFKPALQVLDRHLEGRDWIVGETPTLADISACGYLFYPEPFTFKRAEWRNIDAWLGRIQSIPGWKHPYDLMPGSPADRA